MRPIQHRGRTEAILKELQRIIEQNSEESKYIPDSEWFGNYLEDDVEITGGSLHIPLKQANKKTGARLTLVLAPTVIELS